MPAKKLAYINKFTGDIRVVTKQSAKKLTEDYTEAEFTKNKEGEDVMRLHMHGATVDISENGEREVEDVNTDSE